MNETIAGTAALTGPLLMGWLAWDSGTSLRPYVTGLGLTVVAGIFITVSWRRAGTTRDSSKQ